MCHIFFSYDSSTYIIIIVDDFFNTGNNILQISITSNNPIHETLIDPMKDLDLDYFGPMYI